jgi:hypothetical protein
LRNTVLQCNLKGFGLNFLVGAMRKNKQGEQKVTKTSFFGSFFFHRQVQTIKTMTKTRFNLETKAT